MEKLVWSLIGANSLDRHELVKIKLRSDRDTRAAWIREITQRCGAVTIQTIGQVVSVFRRNPEKPVVEIPA